MIPNICHFVFGLKEQTVEFLFCYFIAVYSAYLKSCSSFSKGFGLECSRTNQHRCPVCQQNEASSFPIQTMRTKDEKSLLVL